MNKDKEHKKKTSNKVYLIHTFGLGDSAMAIDAINTLMKYEKSVEIICKEKSALDYFSYMNIAVKNFSLIRFLCTLISAKFFSDKTPIVIRSAGGSDKSNKMLAILLQFLNIEYFYDDKEKLSYDPCMLLPQRVSSNFSTIQSYLEKHNYINKISVMPTNNSIAVNITSIDYLNNYDNSFLKKMNNINEIIFHFGNTEKYNKVLNSSKIKFIVNLYRNIYPNSRFSIIIGPRELQTNDIYIDLFDDVISNKEISDFLDQSDKYDLCICNDTGIGHILSQNQIKVDLWINSNSNVFLHKIMCKNTNQIIVI